MFIVTFPVDIGTKVKLPNGFVGIVSCYNAVDGTEETDDYIIGVTGDKESWFGEWLLSEVEIISEQTSTSQMPQIYAECILTGYDEYWGEWLECECGYKNNTNGAKFCGGCGKIIQITCADKKSPVHYGCR